MARAARRRARALLRRVGDLMEERVYDIAAALTLEVGKNRMEALGEAQETVDFFHHYADDFERHAGFEHPLPDDPIDGHGLAQPQRDAAVWRVGGDRAVQFPVRARRRPGGRGAGHRQHRRVQVRDRHAVVGAPARRVPARCRLPAGRVQLSVRRGPRSGRSAGRSIRCTAGITFTGSVRGRHGSCCSRWPAAPYPRPCIAEMGGKNPCIVTEHADLERAAAGIVRSAFGMGGQKCSALSRLYVDESVADALIEKLQAADRRDPHRRSAPARALAGPGRQPQCAYGNYARYVAPAEAGGAHPAARRPADARGRTRRAAITSSRCWPKRRLAHPLWQAGDVPADRDAASRTRDRDEAMRLANDTDMGLTAGFYGGADEVPWFHEHIEAGVTYANRPQGATTGAWPGYQPFGGWKGSGSTGKAIASFYYLQQYLREQSRTVVE